MATTTARRRVRKVSTDSSAMLEGLHRQLQEAIATIESGEDWQAWLGFASKLHSYSFSNTILLWCQNPSATHVAGYRMWMSLGRQVRRGETALRVLAPVTRRAEVTDDDGQPRRTADGRVETVKRVVGFRPAAVFDISQTDGPDLAVPEKPAELTGAAPPGLWDALVGEVAGRGYRLFRGSAEQLDGAYGWTKVPEREVWVRDGVDELQACKTLLHEIAHCDLHAVRETLPACRGIVEVEAESVAHLVLGVHGVATGSYSFPYVASWAYPVAAAEQISMSEVVARTGGRVMKAADAIVTATQAATDPNPEAVAPVRPLVERAAVGATMAAEFRDQVEAFAERAAPDRAVLQGVVADSHEFFRRRLSGSWVPELFAGWGLATVIESGKVGYAPAGPSALTDHLRGLGYRDSHIEAAGVAVRDDHGVLTDRLRDRAVTPVYWRGVVVGFNGRAAPDSLARDRVVVTLMPEAAREPRLANYRDRATRRGDRRRPAEVPPSSRSAPSGARPAVG